MAIKEWGFVFKPIGTVDAAARILILIGYPFAASIPPTAVYSDPNINYYRNYTADLRAVRQPLEQINSKISINTHPTSLEIPYYRRYLGDRSS